MPAETLTFRTLNGSAIESRPITLRAVVIAVWTSRDPSGRDLRVAEMEAVGIQRPSRTPQFRRVSTHRLTTADVIEVVGGESSGEVEVVLVRDGRGLWVGVGSDHTDRRIERTEPHVAKQMCDKPIAPDLWAFDDVADHWDTLVLRSWIAEHGETRLYQEGTVAAILPPADLMRAFADREDLPDGTALYCGTFAAIGGIRPSSRFSFELFDPRRERRIAHAYDVVALPAGA
ncbi:DUF2848 domain-containing protein [Rhodoplanes sp. TEM]|uniref:DUF2848 domain-containing protein n=1 Tax=Rhodoplanes tepidamans TaxID=200616 RepID=A0ABT5JE28_RHOTP|nr:MULTISPECIES: DUF2848 domain-containing protein [Rhodoplanes]MDC7787857.1 DUF2848 domain-containing protein [Rhodoplanes tepidamans]MDC7985684.1 DUF2848 domain-containing protein [Rhodoplanes sp. TEM]MDQ0357880.1 hypothetical protein [Rhodoplanes tepidamans]